MSAFAGMIFPLQFGYKSQIAFMWLHLRNRFLYGFSKEENP